MPDAYDVNKIFWPSLVACLVALAQPQLVHAVPFTIEESWWSSDISMRVAPIRGHIEAEWVDTSSGSFFRLPGGSKVEVADASDRQLIETTTLGEGTSIDIRVDGAFDVDFQGLAFDVQGDVKDGDMASDLLWTVLGELPTIEGTLNAAVSSPLNGQLIHSSFSYSGQLSLQQTSFSPSVGTVQIEESFLGLLFDVVFDLSIDRISGGANLGALDDIVLPLVQDFLAEQQFRYYGEVLALAASEPPPVPVSEPQTLALFLAGLVLAGSRLRRDRSRLRFRRRIT